MNKQLCMECKREFEKQELYWVKDNQMIPYKKVCDDCYDKVSREISENEYAQYLTDYELYGDGRIEDDFINDDMWW